MRNVVFLHKRTLYFAVASRKGCVDFSSKLLLWCTPDRGRIPQGMRGFKHCYLINIDIRIKSHPARDAWILASIQKSNGNISRSHSARDAWILATYFTNVNGKIAVTSRKGCVDFSFGTYETEKERDVSHLARDAWILVLLAPIYFQTSKAAEDICCLDYILTSISPTLPFDIQPIQMI